MVERLTKKQKEILDFVIEFIKVSGYSPSYREIADHLGLSSPATIHEHIRGLEDKGYLKAQEGRARSLEPTRATRFKKAIELPLAGLITAGEPI
ncbi:MAG: winged helix-turn-helix transcriptional regulator, partial [Patescibacteria group bacterium]|nr:winged helix-turn-helix transcriptional regulator [Patescibacteria group bacterium]